MKGKGFVLIFGLCLCGIQGHLMANLGNSGIETSKIDYLKKVINNYFKKQDKVILVEEKDEKAARRFSVFELMPLEFPVWSYNTISSLPHPKIKGSISGYPTLDGYIFTCVSFHHCYHQGLLYLSSINPLTNILLLSYDIEDPLQLFEVAWSSHKMLKILIIDLKTDSAYLFNPFTREIVQVKTADFNFEQFYSDRLSNLHGYPLKINIFDAFMLCRVRDEPKKYELACSEVLLAIQKIMNVTLEYIKPTDNEEFGFIHANGTYLGALGELEYGRVDIAVDLRLITEFQNSKNLYFLKAVHPISYCFVVPNNFYPLNFEVFPHAFVDRATLACIVLSMLALIVATFVLNRLKNVKTAITSIGFSYFSLYTNVSIEKTPRKLHARLLCGTMLIFTLIMSNSYQGSIIRQLNNMGSAANIDTLQQLLASGLVIRIPSGPDRYIRDFESFPPDSQQRKLFDQKIITDTSSAIQIKHAAYERQAAILCPNAYIQVYKMQFLSNVTGESLIHAMPECVYSYHMSVMVSKKSPFIGKFNVILQRVVESGVINFQYSKAMAESNLAYTRQVKRGIFFEKTQRFLSMKELFTLFKYYGIWLAGTVFVLIMEILVHKCKKCGSRQRKEEEERKRIERLKKRVKKFKRPLNKGTQTE